MITFTTGNTIEFLYDAAGTKLRKTVKVGATIQYVQDYLPGGIEYRQNGTGVKRVESVYHAEGRYYNTNVDASSTIAWRREYNFKDHLGNTRLVFTDRNANGIVDITGTASTSDVLQENHYYAFGMAFEGAWLQNDAAARDNKYQYNGKEFNDDFGLNWNDYGARWYDASVGRWNGVEPYASKMPQVTGYAYVKNNPIIRLDPNGMWDIIVHAYHDRTKNPYGIAVLYDRHGNEVHRFRVRMEGVAGRDRTITNSDTPVGVYDIPSKDMWLSSAEDNRKSYGPNRRLVLNPLAGEIKDSKRDLIRIHGGRQERKIKEGVWESIDNPQLKRTEGCFRAFDADMAKLYELTQELMSKDSKEEGGFLLLAPDLLNIPAPAAINDTDEYMGNGFYAIPGEGHDLRMQGIGRVINGDFFKLLKELQQEQAAEAKKKGNK